MIMAIFGKVFECRKVVAALREIRMKKVLDT